MKYIELISYMTSVAFIQLYLFLSLFTIAIVSLNISAFTISFFHLECTTHTLVFTANIPSFFLIPRSTHFIRKQNFLNPSAGSSGEIVVMALIRQYSSSTPAFFTSSVPPD
jgi:hypothetical protein